MADDHTPTTEDVRLVYGSDERGILRDLWVTRFDRWLAAHDREVAEKAWDACYDRVIRAGERDAVLNPYREGGAS